MKDRVPANPGRVLITPENGAAAFYATMTRADNPTQEGYPLCKNTLLSDEAETAIFGVPNDRTVNDAFIGIAAKMNLIMSDMASITVTVKDDSGIPVKNVLVEGIYTDSGAPVYTDASGAATGYVTEGSVTISVKNYADLEDIYKEITAVKGASITETLTMVRRNFLKITQSAAYKFSGNISSVDVTAVGGGGGGTSGDSDMGRSGKQGSGAGGGGGYCTVVPDISIDPNVSYPAVVGAGGSVGSDGGESSFLGVAAAGGRGATSPSYSAAAVGGAGNGKGANGVIGTGVTSGNSGVAGTVEGYSSFTETVIYGGGGGSGCIAKGAGILNGGKGAGYGGNGGSSSGAGAAGVDGFGGGGGGGGAYYNSNSESGSSGSGGKGGSGCIAIRMHLNAA